MSSNIIKSSVLNLYDAVTGNHHFQSKISSDRVDLSVPSLPLNIKGTLVNLENEGGAKITDVVSTILGLQSGATQSTTNFTALLAVEQKAREDADLANFGTLNDSIDVNKGLIENEEAARVAENTRIEGLITTETAARTTADTAELTARSNAVQSVQSNLDQRVFEINTAISGERTYTNGKITDVNTATAITVAALQAADTTLTNNLAAEVLARQNEDDALDQRITDEKKISGDGLAAEITARGDADEVIVASVTLEREERKFEVAAERARIDAILDGSGVDLNTLLELVNAYSNADSTIIGTISSLDAKLALIEAKLNNTDDIVQTLIHASGSSSSSSPPSSSDVYQVTSFVVDPADSTVAYVSVQKNGVVLTLSEAEGLNGSTITLDGFVGSTTVLGRESTSSALMISTDYTPDGAFTLPIALTLSPPSSSDVYHATGMNGVPGNSLLVHVPMQKNGNTLTTSEADALVGSSITFVDDGFNGSTEVLGRYESTSDLTIAYSYIASYTGSGSPPFTATFTI